MTRKTKLKPFQTRVWQGVLNALNHRLMRTRGPNQPENAGWRCGTSPSYMRKLTAYWLNGYDWRATERRLNRFPQYVAEVVSHRIHLLYERGSGDTPPPLAITHGWPGSFNLPPPLPRMTQGGGVPSIAVR